MYKCPKCGAEIVQGQEMCNCGIRITWQKPQQFTQMQKESYTDTVIETEDEEYEEYEDYEDYEEDDLTETSSEDSEGNKIAIAVKVISVLTMLVGIFVGFFIASDEDMTGIGFAILAGSIISGIFILGFGEVIQLLQDIKDKLK